MTILIKGIEMPKEGRLTLQISADGAVYVVNSCNITAETYMTDAVPVSPHGRLIDVDVIIKDECHSCDGSCEVIECDCLNCTKAGCDTIRALNDAPTIIEAEG